MYVQAVGYLSISYSCKTIFSTNPTGSEASNKLGLFYHRPLSSTDPTKVNVDKINVLMCFLVMKFMSNLCFWFSCLVNFLPSESTQTGREIIIMTGNTHTYML